MSLSKELLKKVEEFDPKMKELGTSLLNDIDSEQYSIKMLEQRVRNKIREQVLGENQS